MNHLVCERCGKHREKKEDRLCFKCRDLWFDYWEKTTKEDVRRTTMSHEKFVNIVWDEFIAEPEEKEIVQFT